jgi:ribosome-associated translation inhibitor RaiA
MNIQFRQGSGELSTKLISQAQTKLAKLERFAPSGPSEESLAYVDVERESGSRNSDRLWRASINLDLGGEVFNAVSNGETPDKATELAIKELKREVSKAKGKQISIARRGQELLKRLRQREPIG